jgi:uncharacterized protein (TIGR00266 family)
LRFSIEGRPAYSILKVWLERGESITAEPGAFVFHRGEVEVSTGTQGLLSAVARRIAGGESLFLNTFKAKSGVAEVWVAPSSPGDIAVIELSGAIYIKDECYLAHAGDVKLTVGWRGLTGLIAEGELVWLKAEGGGLVFVNTYGGLEVVELGPQEKAVVDNGHVVAMDPTVNWRPGLLGGVKTQAFGGEGIVLHLEGPGRVWIQTRTLPLFARLLFKYVRKLMLKK